MAPITSLLRRRSRKWWDVTTEVLRSAQNKRAVKTSYANRGRSIRPPWGGKGRDRARQVSFKPAWTASPHRTGQESDGAEDNTPDWWRQSGRGQDKMVLWKSTVKCSSLESGGEVEKCDSAKVLSTDCEALAASLGLPNCCPMDDLLIQTHALAFRFRPGTRTHTHTHAHKHTRMHAYTHTHTHTLQKHYSFTSHWYSNHIKWPDVWWMRENECRWRSWERERGNGEERDH